MFKTLDGFELKDGDLCWVTCQCPDGTHKLSPNPRKATYQDKLANESGWDFSIHELHCLCEPEICGVWKNKPPIDPCIKCDYDDETHECRDKYPCIMRCDYIDAWGGVK